MNRASPLSVPTPPRSPPSPAELADDFFRPPAPDRGQSVRSASLMVMSGIAQLVIGAVAVAFLARILTPADFGVFTMAAFLIGFVATFRDFGLTMATVQSTELHHEHASALFWLNLKLSCGMAVLVVACGPVLAWFFGYRALVGITAVLGVGIAVAALANIHQGLLLRGMRFGATAATEVTAVLLGAVAGIAAAYAGAGYWALVVQQLIFFGGLGLLPWLFCSWRPEGYRNSRRHAGTAAHRALVYYGKDLSLSKLVTQLGSSLDVVLIGRFAGAGPLGLYQAAVRWGMLPVQQLYIPLTRVVVATLSRLRTDVDQYRAGFGTAVRSSAALVLPGLAFLFVGARDIVLLLLGPQWLGAVPMFQALTVAAFLDVVRLYCTWTYLTEGRLQRQLRWTLIATPVTMLGISVGILWGALGVAIGYALAKAMLVYPGVAYCLSGSLLRPQDFWRALARPALTAAAAAALLFLVQGWALPSMPLIAGLLVQGIAFASICVSSWLLLPGGRRDAGEMLQLLRLLRPAAPRRDPRAGHA
ncbi:MAG: lipopolysaccharide biosynthesis protein [Longimicrobiaceae bacterium]